MQILQKKDNSLTPLSASIGKGINYYAVLGEIMEIKNFQASVQYNDFKGTAAADRMDKTSIEQYLTNIALLKPGEFFVGLEAYASETIEKSQLTKLRITALATQHDGYNSVQSAVASENPLRVRKIYFEMPIDEFFALFKRFQISISSHGIIDRKNIVSDE